MTQENTAPVEPCAKTGDEDLSAEIALTVAKKSIEHVTCRRVTAQSLPVQLVDAGEHWGKWEADPGRITGHHEPDLQEPIFACDSQCQRP